MASKQHPQHLMAGPSARFGLSHDYPLATAASFSSPNKKWVLNEAKDVVEVVGDGFHHQHHAQQHHHNLNLPQFLEGASSNLQQQQQGFMNECGRSGSSSSLMRYNSAPSCLFSDLDQIARSLNDHNPQIFSSNPPLQGVIDKPQQQQRLERGGANPNQNVLESLKNKSANNNNSSSNAENSRFSAAQSSVVSLGMDFEDQQQEQQQQQQHNKNSNGFTGLLTGSSTSENNNNNNTALFSKAASNLARQSSSPASLLSRLEIDRGQTSLGSSEEDSPLLRSPMNNHSHHNHSEDHVMVASVSGAMDLSSSVVDCGFWDGSSVHPVLQQQHHHHHHQQQHQQQQQQLGLAQPVAHGGVFNLGNGNSPSGSARKRIRDVDMELVDAGGLEHHHHQQQQHTLTRHLSLPVSSRSGGGLLGADNLLQDSVPCRLRAKRGCATHPRSIAERVRRTKISERMRKLQELVPNMDKQTNTSDMLDEAVEYMKFLQKQVEDLRDCKEKCQGLCRMSQKNANSSNPATNNPSSPLDKL